MENGSIKWQAAYTLIEVMMVMVISGVLLAVAIPSFSSMVDKQRLKGVCNETYEQLMLARSQAVQLNKKVYVSFKAADFDFDEDGDGIKEAYDWCVGAFDESVTGCDCAHATNVNKCTVQGVPQVVRFTKAAQVTLYNNDVKFGNSTRTSFSSRDGTALAGHVVVGSQQWGCHVTVSLLGRVRFNKSNAGQAFVPLLEVESLADN